MVNLWVMETLKLVAILAREKSQPSPAQDSVMWTLGEHSLQELLVLVY